MGRSDGQRVGREVGFSKIGMNGCDVGITGASVGSAVGGIIGV